VLPPALLIGNIMRSSVDLTTEDAIEDLFPKQFLDDFTLYLGLDPDVAVEYQPIDVIDHLRAVVRMVEQDQWRLILRKTVTMSGCLEDFCKRDNKVYLPYGPVASLTTFTYLDSSSVSQSVSSDDYFLNTSEPSYLWASNWNSVAPANSEHPAPVTITYTTGYSSFAQIPTTTLQAVKVMANYLFVNRGEESVARPAAYDHLVNHGMLRSQRAMENC
jgi:hypothetical protein